MTKRVTSGKAKSECDAARRRLRIAQRMFNLADWQNALTTELCRELAQARAALRLACNVHESDITTGDRNV